MNIQNNQSIVFPYLDNRLNVFTNEFRFNYLCIQNPQFRDIEKINLIGYNFFVNQYYMHAKACYEKSLSLDNNQIKPLLNYAELLHFEYTQNKTRLKIKYMNQFKEVLKKLSSANISFHQLKTNDIIKEIDRYLSGNNNNYSFIKLFSDINELFNEINSCNNKVFVNHFTYVDGVLIQSSRLRINDICKLENEFHLIKNLLEIDLRKLGNNETFIRGIVNKALDLKINFSAFINENQTNVSRF